MRMHDLHHSAATILLSMKVDAKVVQEVLGHANTSMTLGIYGHVLPSMQREAVDAMNDIFGGKNSNFERFHTLLQINIVDELKRGRNSC